MKCTTCAFPQVNEVDLLLQTGTSARKVAQMFGLARSSVTRHSKHVLPASRPFAVLEGQGGSDGPPDPLAEAFLLAERARTPRERLRALEQVRAATKLRLRDADPDADDRELLDGNIESAMAAYRAAPDFETAARALSGWREAILQRLDAIRQAEAIEVPFIVTHADGTLVEAPAGGKPVVWYMSAVEYWRDVPKRFRDVDRYRVHRVIALQWTAGDHPRSLSDDKLTVYDLATGAVVWARGA